MSNDWISVFRRVRGMVMVGAALAMIVAGVASAAIPTADGTIYACYDKQSGQVRIYDPATNLPKACGPKEVSVTWNAEGTPGEDGADGQDGADGADGVSGYEKVYAESDLDSTWDKTVFAMCPTGKKVVGGGGGVYGELTGEGQVIVHGVGLVQDHPFNDYGWASRAEEFVSTDTDWKLSVWAICADVN